MDGFQSSDKVTVVATTNEPDNVDPALKRAGRFEERIEVGLPDAEGLIKIMQIHAQKASATAKRYGRENDLFASDIDWSHIQESLNNQQYSGADMTEVIRRVLENVMHKSRAAGDPSMQVTTEHIQEVLDAYERRTPRGQQMGFVPQ
jgi:SpoVK/Ycf46/Vps4 family AAA+-type ATPase